MIYFFLIMVIVWLNSSFSMSFDTSTHTLTIPVTSCPPTIQAAAYSASRISDHTDNRYNGWCTLEKSENPEEEKIIIDIKMLNTAYEKIQMKKEAFATLLNLLNTWPSNDPEPYNGTLVYFAKLLDNVIPLFYPKDFSQKLETDTRMLARKRKQIQDLRNIDNEYAKPLQDLQDEIHRREEQKKIFLEKSAKQDKELREELDEALDRLPKTPNNIPSINNNPQPSDNTIHWTIALVAVAGYVLFGPNKSPRKTGKKVSTVH